MKGVRGVERRLGGDEVEIEDFGLDRRAGDGVGDDDLLDLGAELVGVRGQWGVGIVTWGDLADEEVGSFGATDESCEKANVSRFGSWRRDVLAYLVLQLVGMRCRFD